MTDRVAKHFLSIGIQHWGQTASERQRAKDEYLAAAGFDLDNDYETAQAWLAGVMAAMPWGKFEDEADHLQAALDSRAQSSA